MLLLSVLEMSFNIMTLGGMAAAVGLIIDDAIVMIEHICGGCSGGDGDPGNASRIAVAEFTRPLAGSSASTIIIFAPLAFLSGVTGAFFKALSLTMAASLVISFFVAWLVVPLLAEPSACAEGRRRTRAVPLATRLHRRLPRWMMRFVLPRPWLSCCSIVAACSPRVG